MQPETAARRFVVDVSLPSPTQFCHRLRDGAVLKLTKADLALTRIDEMSPDGKVRVFRSLGGALERAGDHCVDIPTDTDVLAGLCGLARSSFLDSRESP
jgi:hypothetical protein